MKEKQIHAGHRSRIRDRARNEGLDHFQDYQVLEYALSFVIPYKDTNPIAHALINRFGSFAAVLEADEEDLKQVKGMGEVSANFLNAMIKFFNFYEKTRVNNNVIINNPADAYEFSKRLFVGKLVEEVYVISLFANNKVCKAEKIAEGTSIEANVDIRKVSDIINRNKVSKIIIAHNHPNGDCFPSSDDNDLTRAIILNMNLTKYNLLDHIIIGNNGFYSYKSANKLDKINDEIYELLGVKKVAQPNLHYGYGEQNDKKR